MPRLAKVVAVEVNESDKVTTPLPPDAPKPTRPSPHAKNHPRQRPLPTKRPTKNHERLKRVNRLRV